jgi:hypothetical protein
MGDGVREENGGSEWVIVHFMPRWHGATVPILLTEQDE